MAVGGICACCAHWLVKGTLIHCPISFTPQAGQGPSRPPTSKPVDCDLGFHPPPLPSLKEDSLASTICRKGPNTILLPLQEALNNYINLPKYGKKNPITNQGGLACFLAAHWLFGKARCPVGRLLPLGVFPLIVGHMVPLVLFNFLEAGSTFWLQTYYRGKNAHKSMDCA